MTEREKFRARVKGYAATALRECLPVFLIAELAVAIVLLVGIWPAVAKVPATPVPTALTSQSTSTTTTPGQGPKVAVPPALPVTPQSTAAGQTTPSSELPTVKLVGFAWKQPDPDLLYIVAVLVLGAIGASMHTLTSYSGYRGNGTFKDRWTWWYLMRIPLGGGVALALYVVMRAGLLSTGTSTGAVSPYGIGAVAILAGLFSKQTIDKLREAFESVFPTKSDSQRTDKLRGQLAVTSTSPDPVPVKPANLTLQLAGTGFVDQMTATLSGNRRDVSVTNATTATLTLDPADVAAAGDLVLIVTLPGPGGASSEPVTVRVRDCAEPGGPAASDDLNPAPTGMGAAGTADPSSSTTPDPADTTYQSAPSSEDPTKPKDARVPETTDEPANPAEEGSHATRGSDPAAPGGPVAP